MDTYDLEEPITDDTRQKKKNRLSDLRMPESAATDKPAEVTDIPEIASGSKDAPVPISQMEKEPGIEEGDLSDYVMPLKGLFSGRIKDVAKMAVNKGIKSLRPKMPPPAEPATIDYSKGIGFRPTKTVTEATTGFQNQIPGVRYKD